MDFLEAISVVEKINPEVASVMTEYNTNFNNTLSKVQTLEKDLKTSAEKRDNLKTIIRNSTGLEEVSEEALKEVLSKGDGQSEVYKKEIANLQDKLSGTANIVDEVSSKYEKEIFDLKLERAVTNLGASTEVHTPHAYKTVLQELSKSATFDGDQVVYKNEDGTTIYAKDGKPATIQSVYNDIKSNTEFSYLFKEQFKSGGGKSTSTGPTVDAGGVSLRRSKLSREDKAKYIGKHGATSYMALPN